MTWLRSEVDARVLAPDTPGLAMSAGEALRMFLGTPI
jgi:hypothetical protein